jgi:hypothetical protein
VYIGYDGLICEATPGRGVTLGSLDDRLLDFAVLVRRAHGLDRQIQEAVARGACFHRNRRYGWRELVRVVLNFNCEPAIRRLNGHVEDEVRDRLVCSTLCSRALLRAGISVLPHSPDYPPPLVTPAVLAQAEELEDVQINWVKVEVARKIGPASGAIPPQG